MADVYGYRIVGPNGVFVPYAFIDLADREHPALILYQEQQDIILDGGHFHRLSVHQHLLGIVVDHQAAHLIDRLTLRVQTAQRGIPAEIGLHPCHQLQGIKGFCNIIVRADSQTVYLVPVF